MELRAFAEAVLFAPTLEGKLVDPGPDPVTDDHPGTAIASPEAPGRPATLRFKPRGTGKSDFPGPRPPSTDAERGRLLHFFANHELLATELMALVLLRFPDAPPAFRRGVYQTLRDEQEHTRLYRDRMRACGVDFGDFPVSGFFWRAVSGMENPIDFVASLSLTFEQANLDFSRHYAAAFRQAGDTESGALLDRIHQDEIAHVAHGLKWFRRWKNPSESDWDAFCRVLRFPLSPQRAKGFTLHPEGRRAAGLDARFVAELEVYSQSRGRTPVVHLFNPFAEAHLDRGPAFTPNRHQEALALDLATLPQFLARPDDVVLVPAKPAVEHLARLSRAGFPPPEFIPESTPAGQPAPELEALRRRKLGGLRPWAWSPDSLARLAPLLGQVTGSPPPPIASRPHDLARLHAKSWGAAFLRGFLQRPSNPGAPGSPSWADLPWVCPDADAGRPASSVPEVLEQVAAIRARGHHRVVVKQDLGLAGAGALRLWEPEITAAQHRWIEQAVDLGRSVVVEPWLDRRADFSVHLDHAAPGQVRLRGFAGLITDLRGQYVANTVEPDHPRKPPARVLRLLAATASPGLSGPPVPVQVQQLFLDLLSALATALAPTGHSGPVGIDAFVHRDAEGRHRLKPVVEINPRFTMGRLALELARHACPGTHGRFSLVNAATLRRSGHASFTALADHLAARDPLALEGHPVPRIRQGTLPLTDPAAASVCLALFQVSPTPFADSASMAPDGS